jgi:hypothetical protein
MSQLEFHLDEPVPAPRARDAWSIWITHPGDRRQPAPPEPNADDGCRPTVEYRDLRDDGGELGFRGACLVCPWRGPAHDDENAAVEDAHDHTHPGWRALPIVDPPPDFGNLSRPEAERRYGRWLEQVAPLYPDDWFDARGPIRTRRAPLGTRHVPGRAPGGGYDLCGLLCDRPLVRPGPEPEGRSLT